MSEKNIELNPNNEITIFRAIIEEIKNNEEESQHFIKLNSENLSAESLVLYERIKSFFEEFGISDSKEWFLSKGREKVTKIIDSLNLEKVKEFINKIQYIKNIHASVNATLDDKIFIAALSNKLAAVYGKLQLAERKLNKEINE